MGSRPVPRCEGTMPDAPMTETTPSAPNKAVNLALQGGGAHGAFTWGVLDHLLEDGRVSIEGVSGTSSGALNAVMLADGLARGGPAEARKRLPACLGGGAIGGGAAPLS